MRQDLTRSLPCFPKSEPANPPLSRSGGSYRWREHDMGRAYPSSGAQDYGQDAGEWQTLRGELMALLDEVETQVARSRGDQGYQGIADRMRQLRDQVADSEPDTRHREALRSVKRAVDRFSDRDDQGYVPRESAPANPRDTLRSAIEKIRARQGDMRRPAPPSPPQQQMEFPRFDE